MVSVVIEIAKLEAFRKRRPVEHLLGQPEHLEHPEHVGSKLDTGADLLELGRLLQHLHRDALARQRQRRRQPPMPPPTTKTGGRFSFALITLHSSV